MNRFLLSALFIILFLPGCFGGTDDDPQQFATALINVELLYAETDEPIAGEPFFVQVREEGRDQWADISEYTSDDNGLIEIHISSTTETKLTRIRIQYLLKEEINHIDEDLDLELKYEEPFDEANLQIRIEGKIPEDNNDNSD